MAEPDFSLPAKPGDSVRLTLHHRSAPWHVQVGGLNLFITVAAQEPVVGAEREPNVESEEE